MDGYLWKKILEMYSMLKEVKIRECKYCDKKIYWNVEENWFYEESTKEKHDCPNKPKNKNNTLNQHDVEYNQHVNTSDIAERNISQILEIVKRIEEKLDNNSKQNIMTKDTEIIYNNTDNIDEINNDEK